MVVWGYATITWLPSPVVRPHLDGCYFDRNMLRGPSCSGNTGDGGALANKAPSRSLSHFHVGVTLAAWLNYMRTWWFWFQLDILQSLAMLLIKINFFFFFYHGICEGLKSLSMLFDITENIKMDAGMEPFKTCLGVFF